jgi:hypothetical protein
MKKINRRLLKKPVTDLSILMLQIFKRASRFVAVLHLPMLDVPPNTGSTLVCLFHQFRQGMIMIISRQR